MPEKSDSRNYLILPSFVVAVALIICSYIVSSSILTVKSMGRVISVTGAAYKNITSDYAVWEGHVNVTSPTMESGYTRMKEARAKAESFLNDAGFSPDNYEVSTVQIYKNRNRDGEITGYDFRQQFKVELPDVNRIKKLAGDASSLIEAGFEFNSMPPRFLFTGLDTLKLEMIRAATENAQMRAHQLAATTGREVGPPVSAQVGVFQIRPRHSQEVSSMGISDVSSVEKEIVSTVHVSFLIE